jgi:hypothetical protein
MKIPKNTKQVYCFFIALLILSYTGMAQPKAILQQLKDTTNKVYGSSDLLNLGELYVAEHVFANGHPYFITNDYTLASVTIHNNTFEKIKARYNIERDQLIIRVNVDSGVYVPMVTKEDWIHSFKINEHYFVSINELQPSTEVKGYCEEVYKGKKMFFIKYKKKFIDNYTDLSPEGFFSVVKISKYVYDNKTFIPVNSRREFLELFSIHKKEIKKFMRKNKIRYAHASSAQLSALMHYCDGL